MSEQSTDVPYNMCPSVYMTLRSVLDGYEETPYNAFDCAYVTSVYDHTVDETCVMPVIHTLDELDLPLHEYIRSTPAITSS
jgi:hypothetical protein